MKDKEQQHTPADFGGKIGDTYRDSTPWWEDPIKPKVNAPNIVFVVLDDVGYSDLGCYGSEIQTPAIDSLANGGRQYTNFHVTPMCSPTRACLLTGRNAHHVGMGAIAEWSCGFPGYEGQITHRAATLAEVLKGNGYNTMCVGKWHLTPLEAMNASGPMDQWPTGRGFERWYGFHGALGDQWYPEMFEDNHVAELPLEEGSHLSEVLVDRAIQNICDQQSVTPDKPFFMYLAFGACHWPHHVPKNYIDNYNGVYDVGWDAIRNTRYQRQKALGVIDKDTKMVPRNPGVSAWEELNPDEQKVAARLQQSYAGFLEHTDVQIGRLLNFLDDEGLRDNTLIVLISDNGATAEGGETGSINHRRHIFIERESRADRIAGMELIGSEFAANCYPEGWAQVSNTPLKWYKKDTHGGGVVAPVIIDWPSGIGSDGAMRKQYHHVIDIMPTILDILDIKAPKSFNGNPQLPVDGLSMRYTFDQAEGRPRTTQYYEILGDRAIWKDGWKAVSRHIKGQDFDSDVWELYHTDKDFSEYNNLAKQHPDKLQEMIALWWSEAKKYQVLPLDDREWDRFVAINEKNLKLDYKFHQNMARIDRLSAPDITDRSFAIKVSLDTTGSDCHGIILAYGGRYAGYCLYVKNGVPTFEYVYTEQHRYVVSGGVLPVGESILTVRFDRTGKRQGQAQLFINNEPVSDVVNFPATWGIHAITGGLRCGVDTGAPVSEALPRGSHFNGRIDKLTFTLQDDGENDPSDTYTAALQEE